MMIGFKNTPSPLASFCPIYSQPCSSLTSVTIAFAKLSIFFRFSLATSSVAHCKQVTFRLESNSRISAVACCFRDNALAKPRYTYRFGKKTFRFYRVGECLDLDFRSFKVIEPQLMLEEASFADTENAGFFVINVGVVSV